jgi:NAD(P)-dependent dehydrogenase (short-subunit alcohol dehydrogenase family)
MQFLHGRYFAGFWLTRVRSRQRFKVEVKTEIKTAHRSKTRSNPIHATSKLALMTFASAFQKHLAAYSRPDKNPMNARVIIVDPGWTRTPGMRRYLSFGSLWGLALYLIMWPFWWLVLKSPDQGAQTFLYAAMEAQYGKGEGGKFLKECREIKFMRSEIEDDVAQKKLWEMSDNTIQALEKEGAMRRAKEKAEAKSTSQGQSTTVSSVDSSKTPGSRRARKNG